jgi:hypothetical protein
VNIDSPNPAYGNKRSLERREGQVTGSKKGTDWPLAKSLAGIPQLYMIALAYGINPLTGQPSPAGKWRVRNVIAWHRPNPPVGALGDKWRPASSTITVACRGQKRWFDLDSVRTPVTDAEWAKAGQMSGESFGGTAANGDGYKHERNRQPDPAGAPPLDWHTDGDLGVGHIVLSTQPYAGSHYATFPMELPRKIIDCMCPRQVCRVCGVARERVTTSERQDAHGNVLTEQYRATGETQRSMKKYEHLLSDQPTPSFRRVVTSETWTDCDCLPDQVRREVRYRPGVVLDPFVGSGTTLAAAQDLGRDGIGIDIDPRNADLARERCGMFLEVEGDTPSGPSTPAAKYDGTRQPLSGDRGPHPSGGYVKKGA